MTNTLWGGLATRKDSQSAFVFSVGINQVGGGLINKLLNGYPVVTSTQVPTDRAKGTASNLTLVLGGVGREWVIGRAGVVSVDVTNSDASKFASRISTFRGTQYVDAGPRHENSFGMIDDVTNS